MDPFMEINAIRRGLANGEYSSTEITMNTSPANFGVTGTQGYLNIRERLMWNNAIFKWWNNLTPSGKHSSIKTTDYTLMKMTMLNDFNLNDASGLLTAGTTQRLDSIAWSSVTSSSKTYSYPTIITDKNYAKFQGAKRDSSNTFTAFS